MEIPLAVVFAVGLDRLLGEPRCWHPLVGFGRLASAIERRLNTGAEQWRMLRGVVAWALAVLPWVGLVYALRPLAPFWVDVLLLYFALGAQSLMEHGQAVAQPLLEGNVSVARERVSCLVSRETDQLDASGVAKAAIESVLENGHDAIFGTLFWFAVGALTLGGGPAVLLFRLSNTLDAMWGYRTHQFNLFGRFAARTDDAMGYASSRLTALSYALMGKTRQALRCWQQQAPAWESPNAGPVMAAGAGSLGVLLGGAAMYHGVVEVRPDLGSGTPPAAKDIARAIHLLHRSLGFWLFGFFLLGMLNS